MERRALHARGVPLLNLRIPILKAKLGGAGKLKADGVRMEGIK